MRRLSVISVILLLGSAEAMAGQRSVVPYEVDFYHCMGAYQTLDQMKSQLAPLAVVQSTGNFGAIDFRRRSDRVVPSDRKLDEQKISPSALPHMVREVQDRLEGILVPAIRRGEHGKVAGVLTYVRECDVQLRQAPVLGEVKP